jgi:bifunctional UDP-N-acetylglucosamine pyrophosphorylase/glucosamine-1-phosphate N-acetyltransferase
MAVDVVILAAGKGSRMKSEQPKVLHLLAGKPLLGHVLDTAATLPNSRATVVIGHGGEAVQSAFAERDLHWALQEQQLGTGHAVQQALANLRPGSTALILYGDVPLIRAASLENLLAQVADNTLALLTVTLDNPTGYGRILRDEQGNVRAIVEEKDATAAQKAIAEVNTGVMALPVNLLTVWLPKLSNNNAQGEFYLTDLVAIARSHGAAVTALQAGSPIETEGVNTRLQLHNLERHYQKSLAETLMLAGVTITDSHRFDCRGTISHGVDCTIESNCLFLGDNQLGNNVSIGTNCVIENARIGNNVSIKANTVIEGPVVIEAGADVGPFARLRPGTILRTGARIGNFVETKKSDIGTGSKVNHLSYIGDTTVGSNANIGAGTITCNYDGINKFKTTIGDGAFIGSNSALVAPVNIGHNATVGAGSTITKDVDDNSLAVARGRQKNLDGWQRPEKIHKD